MKETKTGKIQVGQELTTDQLELLRGSTPTASDILNSIDDLNSELEDMNEVDTESETNTKKTKTLPKAAVPKSTAAQRRRKRKEKQKEETMSFDEELEAMDSELDEKLNEGNAEVPTGDMRSQILDLLNGIPNGPTEADISNWKAKFGDNAVHAMAFGENDVYVFTHLQRGQWKKIQELAAKAQEIGDTDMEDSLKEKVCQYCILYPQLPVEFFYTSRAGVVDSLYQVILLNSYFLTPQQAMLLTTQL